MRRPFACSVTALIVVVCVSSAAPISEDFRKEKVTVARIEGLALEIDDYLLQGNDTVPSLAGLKDELQLTDKRFQDGWGRDLYVFSSGSEYVIISFGKNGVPDAQVSKPGGPIPKRDHDADIVLINGTLAQFPWGVGR